MTGRSPAQECPRGGYAVLTGAFASGAAAFAAWMRAANRELPYKKAENSM